MRSSLSAAVIAATAWIHGVAALGPTDEYRDADVAQSGYLSNHNLDPAIIDSVEFGQLWKVPFNQNEQFYAKPLTYTPLAGGPQLLFLASSQNWIRTLNAQTGAIINTRLVATPFLQSDIGCTDIPNTIGIIGTPVIDPATDFAYFFVKTYIPNLRVPGNTGTSNGVYYLYGVNVNTLQDVTGFPVLIDGSFAQNDPRRYFVGGVILQRPSLTQIGSVVYGTFGGHCDFFNYTGLIVGVDIKKAQIVTHFAVEAGPLAPTSQALLQNGVSGQGGIWMSGMAPASDGNRLFYVTGNGDGHQNNGVPASGSSGCQTLGEACVNMAVDSNGVLSLSDYFQPYDYQNMDAGDQDFGSGGIVLLDPTTFKGTGVNRMAVTAGKNGKIYILNADNLGGYKLGPGQTDGVLQTIVTNKAVFGACGSYPLEGGYIYFTPVGYPTYVYKLGFTGSGAPIFSQVAQSNEVSAARVGVGIPTVTTYKGNPGTAILWMTDPDKGIRAWYAVPQNGVLKSISMPQIGGANKFQRPAFGNGRVYTTDANGVLYCLGAPVALPLNCTSPVDFGNVALGSMQTTTVSCKANIPITKINGATVGDVRFVVLNSSFPTGPLAAGASFSFPVTWDLTNVQVHNDPNASYGNVSPGIKSTPLTIYTVNGIAGYSTLFPLSLTGTEISSAPFLVIGPTTVDYGGIVILDPSNPPTISSPFTITNAGLADMQILGYGYTTDDLDDSPTFTNATLTNGVWDLGLGFTSTGLPAVGSKITGNAAISVQSTFNPVNGIGSYSSFFQVWSNGGSVNIILEGSASTAPIATFSISNAQGVWLPQSNLLMDFGNVAPGSSSSRQIQICNIGGSVLEIDKSKPPNGVFHISDPTQLHESQQIAIGDCAYGTVLMVTNTEEYNVPDLVLTNTWTLNVNDLNFGVHVVQITATVVSNKVGPTNSSGQRVYQYLGCFHEASGGRLFPNQPAPGGNANSNGYCQAACYSSQQYAFAGTEFGTECWCGNAPPPLANQDTLDIFCNYACPADGNDRCGAAGYLSVYYDPTKYTAGGDGSLTGPQTIKVAGNYNFIGCYSEATQGRALTGAQPQAPQSGFTIELCQAACQGYTYFGMEYANQCFCGNTINAGSVNQSSSTPSVNGCSMLCAGNSNEFCGGAGRLNMFLINTAAPIPSSTTRSGTTTSSTTSVSVAIAMSSSTRASTLTTTSTVPTPLGPPYTVQSLQGWSYIGCYTESTTGRALSSVQNPAAAVPVTVESCGLVCKGYTYFGVEYSGECYCGNVFNAGSVLATGSTPILNGCSMLCTGNNSEYCGGPKRLNAYSALPVVISSSTSSPLVTTSSASSSISKITSIPSTTSSSSITTSSTTSTSRTSTTASATSSTSTSSSKSSSFTTSPLATTSTSTTSAAVAASSATGVLIPGQIRNSWAYLGCANETNPRALNSASFTSATTMTIEACQVFCAANNYGLAGVEFSTECYCGNALQSYSAVGYTGCNMLCSGSPYEYCGGAARLSVFSLTTYVAPSIPQVVGSYVSQGCYREIAAGRLLTGPNYTNSTGMTVESCVNFCQSRTPSQAYAGVEYAQECYCANSLPNTAVIAPASSCNMLCKGNNKEYCGAGMLLNIYQYLPAVAATMSSAPAVTARAVEKKAVKKQW